jgi:hypothetical protein
MLSNKYIKNKTIKIWGATVESLEAYQVANAWKEGAATKTN